MFETVHLRREFLGRQDFFDMSPEKQDNQLVDEGFHCKFTTQLLRAIFFNDLRNTFCNLPVIVNQVMKGDTVLRQRCKKFRLTKIYLAAEKKRKIHPDYIEFQIVRKAFQIMKLIAVFKALSASESQSLVSADHARPHESGRIAIIRNT